MSEHRPPVKSFFSKTVTLNPALASRAADEIPPTPAPTTIAVFCLAILQQPYFEETTIGIDFVEGNNHMRGKKPQNKFEVMTASFS